MFERYIHTNECSDEGGWFAYFVLDNDANGSFDLMDMSGLKVNGCATEEEAVKELVELVCVIALNANSSKYAAEKRRRENNG